MAWGTPASLGVASGSSAHSVTLSGVSVSAGGLIVVAIAYRAKAYTDAILVSDSAGNSYTVHKQQYQTTNPFGVAVAYAVATSALSSGSITVSDTASGSTNFTNAVFAAYSVSGGATSSPEDTSVLVSTVGSGQFSSPGMNLTSGTPTQAGDLLIGLFNSTGLSAVSESAGWSTLVDRQQGSGFSNTNISASYYVNSGSGAVTWNPTSTGSGAYVPILIGFKIAPAGGSGVTVEALSGSLAITGQTGSVSATSNKTARAASGSLGIAGSIPGVRASANQNVEANSGSLGLTGQQGNVSVSASKVVEATSGSLAITGQMPSVSVTANVTVRAQAGSVRIVGAGCRVQVTSSASIEANTGRLSIVGHVANVSTRSKARGDDADPRWAPRHVRPIRVIYDEEDVRQALGEPKAKAAPKPTKAKKRKLVRNVERKVLAAASLPEAFAPRIEQTVAQEIGKAWQGPSDFEALSAILNVAAQKAAEEIGRIQAEIEEEDEMILLLAA